MHHATFLFPFRNLLVLGLELGKDKIFNIDSGGRRIIDNSEKGTVNSQILEFEIPFKSQIGNA